MSTNQTSNGTRLPFDLAACVEIGGYLLECRLANKEPMQYLLDALVIKAAQEHLQRIQAFEERMNTGKLEFMEYRRYLSLDEKAQYKAKFGTPQIER